MIERTRTKLNQLQHDLPEGLVVDGAWLQKRGYSSSLRTYYAQNGWLDQLYPGVYRRPGSRLRWEHIVISLQHVLELPLIVGGRTALELQGITHYLVRDIATVHLYGPAPPPHWIGQLNLAQTFVHHNSRRLFKDDPTTTGVGNVVHDVRSGQTHDASRLMGGGPPVFSDWDWPITLSRPERAYLELLDELPNRESFDVADKLMQSMTTLSPRRLQKLLEDCTSIKVKRLFLYFADRHRHAWNRYIDKEKIDLGFGKRVLAKNGRLDPHYLITIPESLDATE